METGGPSIAFALVLIYEKGFKGQNHHFENEPRNRLGTIAVDIAQV